eukprot:534897-Pelagomonas_calceolata.AAC.1
MVTMVLLCFLLCYAISAPTRRYSHHVLCCKPAKLVKQPIQEIKWGRAQSSQSHIHGGGGCGEGGGGLGGVGLRGD